ncbi:hypothetical protein C8F01DRAFT_1142521 [Mycena amicta]|nr:hypothetical protein C8F01DRAFT_1142521 [Mycena amicta]
MGTPDASVPRPARSCDTALYLSHLRSTLVEPSSAGERWLQWDCLAFFDALHTPNVRCLSVDSWDLRTSAWLDMIATIVRADNLTPSHFPHLREMKLTQMSLPVDYMYTAAFFRGLPALKELGLYGCYPGTWEMTMAVLEMDETLCPEVTEVWLSETVCMTRNDPFPGRNEIAEGVEPQWAGPLEDEEGEE